MSSVELRHPHIPCHYLYNFPINLKKVQISHVEIDKYHVMSVIFINMSIGLMSHIDFKKRPCRPVKFKGQESPVATATADGHTEKTGLPQHSRLNRF